MTQRNKINWTPPHQWGFLCLYIWGNKKGRKYIPEGQDEKGAFITKNGKKIYLKEDGTIEED